MEAICDEEEMVVVEEDGPRSRSGTSTRDAFDL